MPKIKKLQKTKTKKQEHSLPKTHSSTVCKNYPITSFSISKQNGIEVYLTTRPKKWCAK